MQGYAKALAPLALAALSACASAEQREAINPIAWKASAPAHPAISADGRTIVMALSGGGARAAAFSLGALLELRDTPAADGGNLADHVSLVSGVSGGAIMAAYYGQHGPAGLDGFRAAYLDKNWSAKLHTSLLWPGNWARAMDGGVNDQTALSDWLDKEVFAGGRMDALWRGQPEVWINATDLYNGTVFTFTPDYMDAVCSDLPSVRVADAVAASMAFPFAFEPSLIEPHRSNCPALPDWAANTESQEARSQLVKSTAQAFRSYRDPEQLPFVNLTDGGVLDNLGLTNFRLQWETANNPYEPFSSEDGARLRRVTFVVMNVENYRSPQWRMKAASPTGPQQAVKLLDIQVAWSNKTTFDAFKASAEKWRDALVKDRCEKNIARCEDLQVDIEMASFADLPPELGSKLAAMDTSVSMSHDDTDTLIEAGRTVIRKNPAIASWRSGK